MASRQILIVVNPASGKSSYKDKLEYLQNKITEEGLSSLIYFTEYNDNGGLRKFLLDHSQITEVIIMGGDGTVNHLVNACHPGKYTMSIVSNGTGNDSVKSLHGVLDFKKQVDIALHGKTSHFDLGVCNERYFVNGVGIGFDGEVVRHMYETGKKQGSHLDYLFTVLRIVGGYKEKNLFFSIDGVEYDREVLIFTVSNGTTFGGGFVINPFAKTDDGLLNLCLINKIAPWKRFWHLPKLKNGGHFRIKEAEFFTATTINIASSTQLVAHMDGEYIGNPPFQISIQNKALKLRTPV